MHIERHEYLDGEAFYSLERHDHEAIEQISISIQAETRGFVNGITAARNAVEWFGREFNESMGHA